MSLNKKIKFFTFYGCMDHGMRRDNSPAADTKTDYIISVLNRIGYNVDIISRASSSEPYFLPSTVILKGKNSYRYFASFAKTRSPLRIVYRLFLELQFFFWSLLNLKRGEHVLVYHSLGYDAAFLWLHKLRSIHIIGDIEEIYQDVCKQSVQKCHNEYKFIDICEKYIFPTQLLDRKVNIKHKPSLVVHGVYTTENTIENKFSDGKIHVVYGGTLDPNKGGAIAAVTAAIFLPKNYHVHVCGLGNAAEIKAVIADVQAKTVATITFEGELKGDEYKHFIQKCHIGLSTQNPQGAFNATSFPSKILMYLSNGLKVVSIRIPAVVQSSIAGNLFFYDIQSPEKIADAIINASEAEQNGNEVLINLDKKFEIDLRKLIEK